MIELRHVQKDFGSVVPLRDVNATVYDGDVIAVIGPSGCGKSTLLRCINLLDPPTGGQIIVDGEDVTAPGYDAGKIGRVMGMVFQRFNLFTHWSVIENVMRPQMDLLGRGKQEAYDKAIGLLRTVGLEEKALSYPEELSGGQMQRIAIARTLAMDPNVILLDEPTSALDPGMVGEVQEVIKGLARAGRTMLIVTHDMAFAREVSNRVFYMDEGIVYEDGTPEQIFENPQRPKTRTFIRRSKVLALHIESQRFDYVGLISNIGRYCEANRIARRMSRRVQAVFEELCINVLVKAMGASADISAVLEYAAEENELRMSVEYGGAPFDFREFDDDLALSLIAGNVSSCEYRFAERRGFDGGGGTDGIDGGEIAEHTATGGEDAVHVANAADAVGVAGAEADAADSGINRIDLIIRGD